MKYSTSIHLLIAGIAFSFLGLFTTDSQAAVFTVTNTNSSGTGSLQDAVNRANYNSPGRDIIRFAIPGAGPHTITLTAPLFLSDGYSKQSGIVLDGTTQAGYSGSPRVFINANGLAAAINVVGNGSDVNGIAVYNFGTIGIALFNGVNNAYIANNWVGFVPSGGGYRLNSTFGGSAYSIGIGVDGSGNNIVNNTVAGVYNAMTFGTDPVVNPSSNYYVSYNNYVAQNRIGLDPSGNYQLGNSSDGIFLGDGATSNYFTGNYIAGQGSAAVELLGRTGWVNYVYGNTLGAGVGAQAIGNGDLGVLVSNGSNYNFIGVHGGNYVWYNRLGGVAVGLNAGAYASGTIGPAYVNYVYYNNVYGNNKADYSDGSGIIITGGSGGNFVQSNAVGGQALHGILVSQASYNNISYNYLGVWGWNGGFGLHIQYSYYDYAAGNAFGYNGFGSIGNYANFGSTIY